MENFNFFNNLFSRVKEHSSPTVNRRSTDGQSQRQYSIGLMKYAAMITLLLTLACGQMWGDDYTIALSSFTESPTGTYTNEGLSGLKCKNYTNIFVEVPSASASGTVSWIGSGSDEKRFLYIYKTNGTVKDETRKIVYAKSYGSVDFTSSDIKTSGGKYYLVFGTTDDWKAAGVKYVLSAPSSTWYVKGDWNSWGTTDNFKGNGIEISAKVNITTAGKYEFKIFDSTGSGTWWGNGGNIGCNVSGWTFESPGDNCTFFASETGNYTFTFNTSTKALSVTYPTAQGKYYYKNTGSWGAVYVYRFKGGINNGWPGTQVVETENICGDTYYFTYADPGTTLIFDNNSSSQTGDMAASGNAGKYVQGTESSWRTFPTYTVTYDGNEKTGGSVPTDGSSPYACGSTVTVLGNTGSLVRTGYNFTGWNTAPNGSGAGYTAGNTFTISANTTLYAQWEAAKYTVTYDVNGGGSVTPTSATQASSGASVTLPTPTWSGYTFEGWYNAGTKIGNGGASYTPTADITLYAHWTDNISGKVFSFIDNNYGDKFKSFTGYGWVAKDSTGRSKTFTNASTGVEYRVSAACWDKKNNAISALAKFKGGTSSMSIVIPTGKIATVKISYNAYGTGDDYRLTVNSTAQANPTTKLADGNTNAQVIANMKEITLSSQTGTLTLGISDASKNNYIGRVSAVITGYVVTYAKGSAGGASGDSFTGTKTAGSSFTLSSSSSAFTREGYGYDGWSVNADGSTKDYNLGGSYTTDAPITLYPHWVAACSATQPGTIGKGTLSACTLRLTAAGSPASNNTWYWQSSADGTDKTESGATKDVTSTGTYYIRSYCTTGSGCWSDAQTVTVSASDLTPAAPTALAAASPTAKGVTLTVTDAANTNDYEFYVSTDGDDPEAGTPATHSVTSGKSLTITDLYAGTTFYAWARAKCGSNKSAWKALTDDTFETSTVSVTHTMTNVTETSSAATSGVGGSDYTAIYSANTDYSLPTPSVTIGGNTATSGTDYTWASATGTITIPANKIKGDIVIVMNSAATAPTQVDISGAYHYYPGETISLTATATGGNGPKTYQWYKGGTADGNAIDGATSATYSKASCVVGDAGDYYCKVTCGGSASRWSDGATEKTAFKAKIMQFYLKNSSGEDISNHALTKVDATHATLSLSLTGGTTYKFRVTDGCNNWYGNSDETGMTSSSCTNWTMPHDADCKMTTNSKSATYTFNFDFSAGLLGSEMKVSIVYPEGNQASGKVIYWDNSVLNWASAPWYRIGKSTHNNKTQMTLVPGTANLYKITTTEYNGFEYWHIANNQGQGTGNIFWTKDNSEGSPDEITAAMGFEGSPATDTITITPTSTHATGGSSDNNNCQFYEYGKTSKMKTQTVTISDYSNGTITVNYVDTSNTARSFTSGSKKLAHTVKLTSITAVANTGYDASAITINGGAYSANYVVTGATTIAASFTPHVYTITLNKGDHGASSQSASVAYLADALTSITPVSSTGYTLTGYYDDETKVLNADGSFAASTVSGYITDGVWTKTANATLTAKWEAKTTTLTFDPNTANHGTAGNGGATATYDATALASVTHTTPAAGYQLDGYYTTASGEGTKIVTASGTLVASTSYTTAGGAWQSELANLTLYARYTDKSYSVTHTFTNASRSSGGSAGASAATHGTDYSVVVAASSGYALPSTITVTIGGETATAGTEYTWNQGTGTVTIGGSYITGDVVITVSGTADCPSSGSGATVYKFVTKSSGLGTSAICTNKDQDYPLTTGDGKPLETLTSGTLTARASSAGTTNLKYNASSINFNGGSAGWLIIGLDCAIQSGDIIRYVNSNSGSVAIHTAKGTSTNEIVLAGNSKTTIQTVVITSDQATAFNGLKTIYMERKSGTSDISYFEIVRPYVVTLNANTNGGKVGGANTATYYAASGEEIALPHAFKSGNYFNGWFPNASTGDAVSNPYTPTGSTTLYAQFGDCPSSGTVYKFQVASSGLTNGSVTANNVDFDFNVGNDLSILNGGTLTTGGSKASYVKIADNSTISLEDNGAYLKVDLDCALEAGDKFVATVGSKTVWVTKNTTRAETAVLPVGTKQETDVPAALVGEKTLYIWRGSGTATISYFEVSRPERFAVTYHKNDGSATTQVNTVSTVEDNMFTRNGYTFVKWHTEADGTSGVDKAVGAAVTAAIDLYAQWECTTPTFDTDLSTTPHVVREGDDAVTLTVAASANSGTVTYQWYSNTSKSTSGATALTTGATYNAPTSSVGTLYYYCVATNTTGGGCTAQSAYATVTVNEVPCFEFAGGTKDSGWPVAIDGSITTSLYKTSTGAVLTGGTVVNSGTVTIGSNDGVKGLVFDAEGNNAITITLSGTHAFAVGTVITISGASGDDNSSSNNFGFSVNGNNLVTTSLSTAKASFEKSYTVAASDGVEGGKTIQIKLNTSCLRKTYLKSVTVTRCAEITGYTIAFEGNGNTGGSMSDVTEIEEGDDVTLAANGFTKNGYSFANWTADVDVTINSATVDAGDPIADEATIENVSSDITLTAVWTPNTYTITYHLNGASWASSAGVASYTVGTGATLPLVGAMTNVGYTFDGWYANSDLSTGGVVTSISTSDYGNKEYWAKWTENTYTITYNKNNGSASGSMAATEGHYVTVASCGFELDGYLFTGWNTENDGTGESYGAGEDIELTANMTLYAQWATDYTISWGNVQIGGAGLTVTPNLGGGNYTITANTGSWTGSLDASMISSETSGVTITNVAVSNGGSPKTITVTFAVGAEVVGESIGLTLSVPAAGVYSAKSDTKAITIDRCTGSVGGSDGVLFSAEFKDSGLGTSNICDAANTAYTFTTAELKSAATGGSIKAFTTDALNHMKFATNAISIAGSDGVIQIDLSSPLATNDLFTYYNVNSSTSAAYLRHTSPTNTTDQIALTVYNKETKVRLTSGFDGKSTLYIVRNNKDFKLHKAAVVRPAFLMLLRDDTPTTTTNLSGTDEGLTTSNYLATIQGGNAYYTSPSSGNLKIYRSSSKNYINFNSQAGYLKIVLDDALQEGDVIGFDSYNTNNLALTTTDVRSTSIVTTNQLYMVGSSSPLKGETTFYIWQYGGSSDYLRGLQIARSGAAGGGGGTDQITTTLSWDPALNTDPDWNSGENRLNKETGDADFTFAAVQDKNSLGALTYSSSNTGVATVTAGGTVHIVGAAGDATITATMAESGCYKGATISYNIHVVDNCDDTPGHVMAYDLGCDGTLLVVVLYDGMNPEAVNYQWYRDGVSLGESYRAQRCTVTVAGEYYAVVDNSAAGARHCAMASDNTVVVEARDGISAEKIVDQWYVKNGRRTPDIELVQTTGATGFIVKIGETTIWNSDGTVTTGFGGCGFHLGENGIIYLNGTKDNGDAPSGLTGDGETEILKITAKGCGGDADELSITIHKQVPGLDSRPSVAFVVDGTEKGTFAQANADHSTNSPLYQFLDYGADESGLFDLTAQNIYSSVNEKELREHYSQFDAIIITDDPSTDKKKDGKSYVNAFGTMIDVRPILTMEAFVSKLANWKAKGINGNPESPSPRQYAMTLQCKDHEIFFDIDPKSPNVAHEEIDGVDYWTVTMVDKTKSPYSSKASDTDDTEGTPALQGFSVSDVSGLLLLGEIKNGDKTMFTGVERQEEPAARLMLLGIQNKALPNALTTEGKTIIENAVEYLLKTNMEEVDDCSNYFIGGGGDNSWETDANWFKGKAPNSPMIRARILAPCEVSTTVHAAHIDIVTSGESSKKGGEIKGQLTIKPNGAVIVGGEVRAAEAPYFNKSNLKPTEEQDLKIETSADGQGALILNNDAGDTKATVEYFSLGRKDGSAYQFQYFASPMGYLEINPAFAGAGIYTYAWNEAVADGWERRGYYTDVLGFEGLAITTKRDYNSIYTLEGALASTADVDIPLTYTDAGAGGQNLIGNSWTAPINIASLVDAFEDDANVVKTVNIYNSGNDDYPGLGAAGTWTEVPISVAEWPEWTGLKVIPAMQAFRIDVTGETKLTMNYEKMVRETESSSLNEPLKAPSRYSNANGASLMRMRLESGNAYTDLFLIEGEQFSEAFDNGYEAKFIAGEDNTVQFYAMNGEEKMAVLATDALEGTPVGFVPGKGTAYTISFSGDGMGYYLNDVKKQTSTLISEENTYSFEYEAGDDANRFYISATPFETPSAATGVTNLDAAAPKAQKIIYNDKLYIIRGGKVFSADGQLVK